MSVRRTENLPSSRTRMEPEMSEYTHSAPSSAIGIGMMPYSSTVCGRGTGELSASCKARLRAG